MFLSVPKSPEDFKRGGLSFQMEVIPGWSVFSDPMPGIAPKGVLVAWEHLDADQQAAFHEVHEELTTAAVKLKELFQQVGGRVED